MRGRKPVPTSLKILHNNPGRRPLNPHEPDHPSITPDVPSELRHDRRAVAEWNRLIGMLGRGHVTEVDRAVLMAYCLKYAQWIRLELEAAKRPYIVRSRNHGLMLNPALSAANRLQASMLRAAVELGITPSARVRIALAPPAPDPEHDPFSQWQRQRQRL